MKLRQISAAFLFKVLISANSHAQRIKLIEGDISSLSGQTVLNTEFSHDNMEVSKLDKEADYDASKKEELNKKEAGRGDNWAKS